MSSGNDAPLMLGVSGMRGIVGKTLTPPVAARYGAAFGQWLRARRSAGDGGGAPGDKSGVPNVVVGRDSRQSGAMLELAAASGLLAAGCQVTTLGIVSTPGVAVMAEALHAAGGLVITASHNPIQWNGIKALTHEGVAPPPDQAKEIIRLFQADAPAYVAVADLPRLIHAGETADVHVGRVLSHVRVDAIRSRKLRIVLDSVCGAGGPEGAQLLNALGVELIHLYPETTGQFPHEPEPLRENLTELGEQVRKHHADVGFAQDPDADRLVVVDENGAYIGEEYTLVLACLHVLSQLRSPGGAQMAANLSTSRMIDDVAQRYGATVIRTAVGEANVAAAMRASGAAIGGEGNGGVIWPQAVFVRDSIAGMALILEMLALRQQKLSAVVASTPGYTMLKEKIPLDPALVSTLPQRMERAFGSGARFDLQDGVRVDFPDRWVHVRSSNTEPIVRLIAEAADPAGARTLIDKVRAAL